MTKSFKQMGAELNVSKQRARQLTEVSLAKLRKGSAGKFFREAREADTPLVVFFANRSYQGNRWVSYQRQKKDF